MKLLSARFALLSALTILLVRLLPGRLRRFRPLILLSASLAVLAFDPLSLIVLCVTCGSAYAGMLVLERLQERGREHGVECTQKRGVERGRKHGVECTQEHGVERTQERDVERAQERGREHGMERTQERDVERAQERSRKRIQRIREVVLAGLLIWQVLLFVRFQGRCLGISYVTLILIGLEIEVFRAQRLPEKNILRFAADVLYFPRLFSGPIVQGGEIHMNAAVEPPVAGECESPAAWECGPPVAGRWRPRVQAFGIAAGPLRRILWGLFKKLVLADRLAIFVSAVFDAPHSFSAVMIWLAVIAASIQIYADFSGCMDVVLGLSALLGVRLPENFSQPFFAAGFADYWRRWHMTMGRWFRTCLFYPVGMNGRVLKLSGALAAHVRGRQLKKCAMMLIPLFTTWAATGLWHGFSPHFLVWGLLCAFLILLESARRKKPGRNAGTILITFLTMSIVRVMFRASSVRQALRVYAGMLRFGSPAGRFPGGLDRLDVAVVLTAVLLLGIADVYREKKGCGIGEWVARLPMVPRWMLVLAAAAAVLLAGVYGPGYAPAEFVYGRF